MSFLLRGVVSVYFGHNHWIAPVILPNVVLPLCRNTSLLIRYGDSDNCCLNVVSKTLFLSDSSTSFRRQFWFCDVLFFWYADTLILPQIIDQWILALTFTGFEMLVRFVYIYLCRKLQIHVDCWDYLIKNVVFVRFGITQLMATITLAGSLANVSFYWWGDQIRDYKSYSLLSYSYTFANMVTTTTVIIRCRNIGHVKGLSERSPVLSRLPYSENFIRH